MDLRFYINYSLILIVWQQPTKSLGQRYDASLKDSDHSDQLREATIKGNYRQVLLPGQVEVVVFAVRIASQVNVAFNSLRSPHYKVVQLERTIERLLKLIRGSKWTPSEPVQQAKSALRYQYIVGLVKQGRCRFGHKQHPPRDKGSWWGPAAGRGRSMCCSNLTIQTSSRATWVNLEHCKLTWRDLQGTEGSQISFLPGRTLARVETTILDTDRDWKMTWIRNSAFFQRSLELITRQTWTCVNLVQTSV